MLVVPLVSKSSGCVIRLSQQGEVCTSGISQPFFQFSLIYQLTVSHTPIAQSKTPFKLLFSRIIPVCSLKDHLSSISQHHAWRRKQGPRGLTPRHGLESHGQGGHLEDLQEEDDHHFHCRRHTIRTAVCQSSCCKGVMRHSTDGRS